MKIPFYLVTGFLGSGKTTFLKQFLSQHSASKRIAVIQNEFASTNLDGAELQDAKFNFSLLELNQGSVFCVCLFSGFKENLLQLLHDNTPDLVLLEATGIADPIAIAQLLEDKRLKELLFVAHIWSIIDAPRYLVIGKSTKCIRHQIEVADTVLVNKTDLITEIQIDDIDNDIKSINPFAHIEHTTHCLLNTKNIVDACIRPLPVFEKQCISGELTRCGDGNYQSQVFKTTQLISEKKLFKFINSLDDTTFRIKGYIQLDDKRCVMLQYVPNQFEVIDTSNKSHPTELIAIGVGLINFEDYLL